MALTSTQKSAAFRQRNKDAGRTELRGIWATAEEQAAVKKIIREKLEEIRKENGTI